MVAARSETKKAVVTLPTRTTILITRDFAAPKQLVYRAWTTPELIERWWHAKRGKITSIAVDLRVGGKWRWVMVADHGGFEVAFHGEYLEIVPDERLVFTEVFEGAPEGAAVTSVAFSESGGRTQVSIHVQHETEAHRDMHINSGMEDGMQDALDLLEQVAQSL